MSNTLIWYHNEENLFRNTVSTTKQIDPRKFNTFKIKVQIAPDHYVLYCLQYCWANSSLISEQIFNNLFIIYALNEATRLG